MKTNYSYFRCVFQGQKGVLHFADNLNKWLFFPNSNRAPHFPFKAVKCENVKIIEQTI